MEKKNEGAGVIVILTAVFLTLGILNISFAFYDRWKQVAKAKEKGKEKSGDLAKN